MTFVNNKNIYSVLMPLFYKEKIEYLKLSLESMLKQSISPAEIVLITEHELMPDMLELLEMLQQKYSTIPIRVILNKELEGKGLGAILAYGVENCQYDIIARMDTDDISFPKRCEKELAVLATNPDIAIVGGGIKKFNDIPGKAEGYRIPPEKGERLIRYSKFRCPFNHPTVMFRKKAILKAGNYAEIKEGEDYDLWYRVLKMGYCGYNLQTPILHYRSGTDVLKRRKNRGFYDQSLKMVRQMKNDKYINIFEAVIAMSLHTIRYYSPLFINEIANKYIRN